MLRTKVTVSVGSPFLGGSSFLRVRIIRVISKSRVSYECLMKGGETPADDITRSKDDD